MKNSAFINKIRLVYSKITEKIKASVRKTPQPGPKSQRQDSKLGFNKPQSIAYRIMSERTVRILPLFEDLGITLRRSGVKIGFKSYVNLTILVSAIIAFATLLLIPLILFTAFAVTVFPAIMFGVGGALFALGFSVIGFYFYPIYRADKLKRNLDDELPFTTGYMAILTSAGVSPEKMFYSLSTLSVPLAVSVEAKNVVRNVNLFGKDIISALEETSKQSPSDRFREMLEGFISTIHSGGDSTAYLQQKSKQYMKLKRISLKKFSDTLSVLSEFYVAILLTGPLLLVIMLSVMAMLGGTDLGLLSPDLLLNLLTYVGIPMGAVIFLIVLDAVTPKW